MNVLRSAGWLAVAAFLALVVRFHHPVFGFTSFLQLDAPSAAVAVDAFHEYPVYIYHDTGPYDGQLYAQIATDPTLRDPQLRRGIDNLVYRGRRILAPALAWALAGGNPAHIAQIYSILNVAAWLVLAALLWLGLPVQDARGFIGWTGVLFSAGALTCVRLSLTDLIGATLLFSAILCAERRRSRTAVALAALGGLARETSLFGVAGLWSTLAGARNLSGASAEAGGRGGRKVSRLAQNFAKATLAALPLLLWIAYVRFRVGPGDVGWGNFTWPASGWIGKWIASLQALRNQGDLWLSATTLLAVLGLTVQACWFLRQWSPADRWWRMGAPYALLMLLLGRAVWEDFPGAAFRTLLPLTVAFNVLAVRRRAAWTWLLLGNLTVLSGLLALRDVPIDNREAGAVRAHGDACLVRTGSGWFGTENNSRHRWTWSTGQPSTLDFQLWPAISGEVRCEGFLVSLRPGHVELRNGDRLCWSGGVGRTKTPINFAVEVRNGRGQVVFTTDAPAVPEAADAGARRLAFALYDLKVTLPDAQSRSH